MKSIVSIIGGSMLVSCLAEKCDAKPIPVEIHWTGAAPTDVLVDEPGGFQSLGRDDARNVFHGTLTVSGDTPQRHTITVRYGNYYHPFDVRVHRFLPSVTFSIEHQTQRSCTLSHVQEAGKIAGTLPDAINRGVNAGELLSIGEPNACDASLSLNAAQAAYRQNVRMSQLSNGFFLINPETKQAYEEIAARHGLAVSKEVAAYDKQDQQLEAKQLITIRSMAQAEGDYSRAVQVNDYILRRVSTSAAVAGWYRKEGVTSSALTADAKFLQDLASQQSAAAMGAITTDQAPPKEQSPKNPQ